MANSSRFVLPMTMRAGGDEPLDHRGVVRRPPAVEDPRRARGGDAPRAHVVLERDRHAGQRPGVLAGRDRSSITAAAARASSASTRLKAWTRPRARRCGRGAPRPRRRADRRPAAHVGGDLAGAAVTAPRPGSAARGSGRPRPPAPRPAPRRGRAQSPITSSRSTFASGYGCVIGSTSSSVERVDVGEVVEHVGELLGVAVELLGREGEPGQRGHVGHVVGGDAVGHGRSCYERAPEFSASSTRTPHEEPPASTGTPVCTRVARCRLPPMA